MTEKSQECPVCGVSVPHVERHSRYLCEECASQACSEDERPLSFSNVDIFGGFQAAYTDTGEPYGGHVCYVRGVRCWADEYKFGGIVIETRNDDPEVNDV